MINQEQLEKLKQDALHEYAHYAGITNELVVGELVTISEVEDVREENDFQINYWYSVIELVTFILKNCIKEGKFKINLWALIRYRKELWLILGKFLMNLYKSFRFNPNARLN